MKIVEIIESKRWLNKKTLQTASIYGSVPWTSDTTKQDWELVIVGFTWRLDNGTVGLGRTPAKTLSEAQEVMFNFNKLSEV